jgi:hypothetical protein
MNEEKPRRHPLFSPDSRYSRMRSSVRPENKMRGYFLWLGARAVRRGIEARTNHLPGGALDQRALGLEEPQVNVLDVLEVRPLVLPLTFKGVAAVEAASRAKLFVVREEDGANTLGLILRPVPDTLWDLLRERGRPLSACRAFLLEPEVVERLAAALQLPPERSSREHVLRRAFAPETLTDNVEVARILSAVPELEGECSALLRKASFRRLPVPATGDGFPPSPEPPAVVVTIDLPDEGP